MDYKSDFDLWWENEYPKLANGQNTWKGALEAAWRDGFSHGITDPDAGSAPD